MKEVKRLCCRCGLPEEPLINEEGTPGVFAAREGKYFVPDKGKKFIEDGEEAAAIPADLRWPVQWCDRYHPTIWEVPK